MRMKQIDGLRFWACMVILADHCRVLGLRYQGGIMVSLFFVLSGFFIANPLKQDGEERFLSIRGWGNFYLMRIVRIVPMHWFALILVSVLFKDSFTGKRLLRLMFFMEGWRHLWFLTHEMLCYLIIPVVMLAAALLKRHLKVRNIWLCAGFLVFSAMLHIYLYKITSFRLLNQPFRFDLFVLGISFGYLCKSGILKTIRRRSISLTADLAGILLILSVYFTTGHVLAHLNPALSGYQVGWERPWLCGFFCGIMILLLVYNPNGLVSRFFSLPWFVRLGQASYGIYILHYYYFMMDPWPFVAYMRNFIANVLVSSCVSVVFFEWIEEPFYRNVKKLLTGSSGKKNRPGTDMERRIC